MIFGNGIDGACVVGLVLFALLFISVAGDMTKQRKEELKKNKDNTVFKSIVSAILTYKAMEVLERKRSDKTGKVHKVKDEI